MEITNKLFTKVILSIIVICVFIAVTVRFTIKKFTYNDFYNKTSEYVYIPYSDDITTNGVFENIDYNENIDLIELSDCIIIGKTTGVREILPGTILTEIEINRVVKGEFEKKNIYIYEPVSINSKDNKTIQTFMGYNVIKENKEYVFCLKKLKYVDNHMYTEKEKNSYTYVTPLFSKFSLNLDESEYGIFGNSIFENSKGEKYDDYKNYEFIFDGNEWKDIYFRERDEILKYIELGELN